MSLNVYSEIGRLREVLVHSPGPEVDSMPPSMMHELLFDDIIYGDRARQEHRRFCSIMSSLSVRVHDTRDLLSEALMAAPDEERDSLLTSVGRLEDIDRATLKELRGMQLSELAGSLIEGIRSQGKVDPENLFRLPPLPNLLFSRDAQIVLGTSVIISSMSRRARQREPLLSRFLFRNHPRFASIRIHDDYAVHEKSGPWQHRSGPTIEGGDVLVFSEGVVLVGVSERTMERAVDRLATWLRNIDPFHTLIMVPLPKTRSSMHLDTIFTRCSREECLVYGPMILPDQAETLSVIRIDLRRADDWGRRDSNLLASLIASGVDLEPICCGGSEDYIRQAREQWTDGANSFAVAPGIVFLYGRNEATAEELDHRGYEIVSADAMDINPDGTCSYPFVPDKKYAILIAGQELSRARGGPRCMTMPLRRDALE